MEIDYYSSIFKRKSTKRYDPTPLSEDTLKEILNHLNDLKPLYDDINTEVKILPLEDVQVKKKKKEAPHYFAMFSQTKDGYFANLGFMMQQMDLFLNEKGIGSCWQGSPKPKEEVLKNSDLEFVIVMAFGNPRDSKPVHRDISEFERKSLSEISTVQGAEELLEAARLAPSSGNIQPWFFTGDKSLIHVYTSKAYKKKDYPLQIIKKYNNISVGIALYHFKVAAEHFGKNIEILFDKKAENDLPNGYEYTLSLKID